VKGIPPRSPPSGAAGRLPERLRAAQMRAAPSHDTPGAASGKRLQAALVAQHGDNTSLRAISSRPEDLEDLEDPGSPCRAGRARRTWLRGILRHGCQPLDGIVCHQPRVLRPLHVDRRVGDRRELHLRRRVLPRSQRAPHSVKHARHLGENGRETLHGHARSSPKPSAWSALLGAMRNSVRRRR
jgi:hypothetical protein